MPGTERPAAGAVSVVALGNTVGLLAGRKPCSKAAQRE